MLLKFRCLSCVLPPPHTSPPSPHLSPLPTPLPPPHTSPPHTSPPHSSFPAVGKTGQHNLLECGTDLDQAKQLFTKKYATLVGRERGKAEMRGKGGEGRKNRGRKRKGRKRKGRRRKGGGGIFYRRKSTIIHLSFKPSLYPNLPKE